MTDECSKLLGDPSLIDRRDAGFADLQALLNGHASSPVYLYGVTERAKVDPYAEPERWVRKTLEMLCRDAAKTDNNDYFRPLCLEFGPYGVHFSDSILGARVFRDPTTGAWYNETVESPIGELPQPYFLEHPAFLLATRVADEFIRQEVVASSLDMEAIRGHRQVDSQTGRKS